MTTHRGLIILAAFGILGGAPPDDTGDGYRNRLVPSPAPTTRQDFGYRPTRHAGGAAPGEIGGRIQRSTTPAWYAKVLAPVTLENRLRASGRFAVTHDDGSSGALVGWFRHDSRGWRTPNALAFRVDGNGGKYWVLFEYGTRLWSTGGGATFEGIYQTTRTKPFLADGTVHDWALDYDPRGRDQDGRITFTLDGKDYTIAVPRSHKAEGAEFDRFGLFNQQITGGGLDLYVDDLILDGRPEDLSRDPNWEAHGNHVTFEDRVRRPFHDFGRLPNGGIGGVVWRDEAPAYFGETVGPFTLDDSLEASGTIRFLGAGSDSGVYFGWFDAAAKRRKTTPEHEEPQRSIVAVLLEGPSRIGHYVRPAIRNAEGQGGVPEDGPILRPDGSTYRWTLRYDPNAAGGNGRVTVTLDGRAKAFDLAPGQRARGARFDCFGLFNMQSGGHHAELILDDLKHGRQAR